MTRFCVDCQNDKTIEKPTFATFGEVGKSPMYCKKHMKHGMVNMKDDVCHCGESKPSFNVAGEKKALYCIKCKGPNMINVKSKMCVDCQIRKPSFNVPGKAADYCKKCVIDNNHIGMVNVNNKKCAYLLNGERCVCNPKFNLPGQKGGLYCNKHKKEGMIHKSKMYCLHEGCE